MILCGPINAQSYALHLIAPVTTMGWRPRRQSAFLGLLEQHDGHSAQTIVVVVLAWCAMNGTSALRPEPLPSIWRVLLFRIWQAEQRDRILSDWEDNVFGIHLSLEEKQRLH